VKNANYEFGIPINVIICLPHALCNLKKTNRTHSSKMSIFFYLFILLDLWLLHICYWLLPQCILYDFST